MWFYFSSVWGTMMDFWSMREPQTERGQIENSVNTPASWKAPCFWHTAWYASGPTALRMLTRLKDRVTSATERVSGRTSSAAAVCERSLCVRCYQPRTEHKRCWGSSGREAAMFTVAGLLPLKPVMVLMPCHMLLGLLLWSVLQLCFYMFVWLLDGSPEIVTGLFPDRQCFRM